jgi:hypothetical protein
MSFVPHHHTKPHIIYTTLRTVTDAAKCCGTNGPQQILSLKPYMLKADASQWHKTHPNFKKWTMVSVAAR